MNLMHRASLSQQQTASSRGIICPVCELPALFAVDGRQHDGQESHGERWVCSNCGIAVALSDPWPIAPVSRALARYRKSELLVAAVLEDSPQFDLAEIV
ncbi:MAG: hypothetical protein ACOYZ7_18685 [Chloroflexota bacterium]